MENYHDDHVNIKIDLSPFITDDCQYSGSIFLGLKSPKLLLTDRWVRDASVSNDFIYLAKDCKIFNFGFRYESNGNYADFIGWPKYLESELENQSYKNTIDENKHSLVFSTIECGFHFFHPHCRLYGHFLMECLYKLFIYREIIRVGCNIPVILPKCSPSFVKEWVFSLIDRDHVLEVDCDNSFLVKRLYDFSFYEFYVYPNHLVAMIQHFVQSINNSCESVNFPKKIFISRKNVDSLTDGRILINENQLQDVAISNDYVVLHPEEYSIIDQVKLFGNATHIVGEYGSALHNAIFSKRNTSIVVFNHINHLQQSIARSFGHKLYFIMPRAGRPVCDNAATITASNPCQYAIDANVFNELLDII